MANNSPIGVYDSGFGGLSVWGELRKVMPSESLVYLGDGKNCPYGLLSREELLHVADMSMQRMVNAGCKMIVVACNTVSTNWLEFLTEKYNQIPIVGTTPPVEEACEDDSRNITGVLVTERASKGIVFRDMIAKYSKNREIIVAIGHGFVELVEQNLEATPEAEKIVREAMAEMMKKDVDQIVLGCTHYPFLLSTIRSVLDGKDVDIVDPAPFVALRVKALLEELNISAQEDNLAQYDFITYADDLYIDKLKNKAQLTIG